MQDMVLVNYVFSAHLPNHAVAVTGLEMIFNHMNSEHSNIKHDSIPQTLLNSSDSFIPVTSRPYGTYVMGGWTMKRSIEAGEEIFTTYGGRSYFASRSLPPDFGWSHTHTYDSRKLGYSTYELSKIGHCLTNIVITSSKIPMAGQGVEAAVNFSTGSSVYVSPTLAVSKHKFVDNGRDSVLINYCISTPGSDLAFLPTGRMAMVNHGGSSRANVGVRWFEWGRNPEDGPVAAADLFRDVNVDRDLLSPSTGGPVYLEYFALRDIAVGEELLLDYGDEWEGAWRVYLTVLHQWMEIYGEDASSGPASAQLMNAPQFRHAIGNPSSLPFPPQLMVECTGRDCRKKENSIETCHKNTYWTTESIAENVLYHNNIW